MGYEYSMRPGFKGCSLPDSRGSEGAGVVTVLIMATLGAILARPSHAQSFEVASVRVGAPIPIGENYNINLGTVSHGTLTLTNTTLADCLRFAYSLTSDSLIAGEGWIKSKEHRYTIVAKGSPETTRDEMLRMLQGLLTERFKLDGTVDMFNLINKFNVADVNVLWTTAGKPTASFDPRQFQFGLKLSF